jgi:N-acetyl-anhydromuramyl-L-alanine amidase AmpD
MGRKDVNRVFAHKEWAPGRKIDPAGIEMDEFRKQVQKALNHGPTVKTVSLSRLQPGKRNTDVVLLKKRLRQKGFYEGSNGKFFGKNLQRAYAAFQVSLGYSGADADGVPGVKTLRKLGFRVVE